MRIERKIKTIIISEANGATPFISLNDVEPDDNIFSGVEDTRKHNKHISISIITNATIVEKDNVITIEGEINYRKGEVKKSCYMKFNNFIIIDHDTRRTS